MADGEVDLGIPGVEAAVEVGRGGFATVYRAHQPALERDVAIKVVHPGILKGADDKFTREVRAAGRLSQHPNVVPVYDVGTTANGQAYLMMPFYERGSLDGLIGQRGALPEETAVRIGRTLANTLDYVHQRGVLHRDVKPANILLAEGDEPLLGDFGVARVASASMALQTVGANVVTWAYGPPEAFTGGEPTPAWDVYSLGATVYAMLAGSPPFVDDEDANVFAVLNRIGNVEVPDLRVRGVSPAVAAAVRQAMAKAPEDRPASAAEFGSLLVLRVPAPAPTAPPLKPPVVTPPPAPSAPSSAAAVVAGAPAAPVAPAPPPSPRSGAPIPVAATSAPSSEPPEAGSAKTKGTRVVGLLILLTVAAQIALVSVNVSPFESANRLADDSWGSTTGLAKGILLWGPSLALLAGFVLLLVPGVAKGISFEWILGAAVAMFVFDAWFLLAAYVLAHLDSFTAEYVALHGAVGLGTVLLVLLSWRRARQPGAPITANQRWLLLGGCGLLAIATLLAQPDFLRGELWLAAMVALIAVVLVRSLAMTSQTTGAAALTAIGVVGALVWLARLLGDREALLANNGGAALRAFLAAVGFGCVAAVGIWRWRVPDPAAPATTT